MCKKMVWPNHYFGICQKVWRKATQNIRRYQPGPPEYKPVALLLGQKFCEVRFWSAHLF
jgi:hypothetical protein